MSLEDHLQQIYGYSNFREGQKEVIESILNKQDVLVLMPTGAGKSLCFQLPAIISKGVTIVISPLISLIYDQVMELRQRGVCCYSLNSTTSVDERFQLFDDLKPQADGSCNCKLIYTTPETLSGQGNNGADLMMELYEVYESGLIEGVVIDEAHCVSNWGHDFRQSYLQLDYIKNTYVGASIWAFTATATPKVQLDIVKSLQLSDYKIFRNSFIRENLSYQIFERPHKDQMETKLVNLLKGKYNGKSGIIYCLRRADCEKIAKMLQRKGICADYYHASMLNQRKEKVQLDWINGKLSVIVATIAFALGINKPDVRYVIHLAMPKSIESYYQEAGRAGRDGKHSDCLLFYSYGDKVILQKIAEKSTTSSGNAPTSSKNRLGDMLYLCQNRHDCTKQQMSNYLGEFIRFSCINCPGSNYCRNCAQPTTTKLQNFNHMASTIFTFMHSGGELHRGQILKHIESQPENKGKYTYNDINRILNYLISYNFIKVDVVQGNKGIVELLKLTGKELADKPIRLKYGEVDPPRIIDMSLPNPYAAPPNKLTTTASKPPSIWQDESIMDLMNMARQQK